MLMWKRKRARGLRLVVVGSVREPPEWESGAVLPSPRLLLCWRARELAIGIETEAGIGIRVVANCPAKGCGRWWREKGVWKSRRLLSGVCGDVVAVVVVQ